MEQKRAELRKEQKSLGLKMQALQGQAQRLQEEAAETNNRLFEVKAQLTLLDELLDGGSDGDDPDLQDLPGDPDE